MLKTKPPPLFSVSPLLSGALTVAISAVESALMAILGEGSALMVAVPGMVLGLFGGLAAAILPVGRSAWAWWQALRVMALGLLLGSFAAFILSDWPTCTGAIREDCIGLGTKRGLMFLAGLIGEQGLLLLSAAGRQSVAESLRSVLAWVAKVATPNAGESEP